MHSHIMWLLDKTTDRTYWFSILLGTRCVRSNGLMASVFRRWYFRLKFQQYETNAFPNNIVLAILYFFFLSCVFFRLITFQALASVFKRPKGLWNVYFIDHAKLPDCQIRCCERHVSRWYRPLTYNLLDTNKKTYTVIVKATFIFSIQFYAIP